jgi:hypothetical protein
MQITQIKKKSAKSVVICVICVKQGGLGTGNNLPLKQSPLTNYLPLKQSPLTNYLPPWI